MVDFYKVLGVGDDASGEEIKAAYRKAAFAHHPDTNPSAGRGSDQRFVEVQEAWNVLRDEGKRAQYDRMRQAGYSGGGSGDFEAAATSGSYSTPWGQPSMDAKEFDAAFDAWWKRYSEGFDYYEERQFARDRMNADRRAKAAAWEWEKQQAQLNKLRTERLKHRTEDARMHRHAAVLRKLWQTHSGLTRGDALVAALFLAGTVGIALTWRVHLQEARQEQHSQQQPQQGQVRQAPLLPAAAMAATAQPS